MKFSLLCPCRARIAGVRRLLESVRTTTTAPSDVEVLLKADQDDTQMVEALAAMVKEPWPFAVKTFIDYRSPYLQEDYYNYLARRANGEFVWAAGDDTEIETVGWDTLLKREIERFRSSNPNIKDEYLYVSIEDTTPLPSGKYPPFCCFPVVSMASIKTLGFLFHPDIMTWGADYVLFQVYSSSALFRVIVVDQVVLRHHAQHNNSTKQDQLNKDVATRFRLNSCFIFFSEKFFVPKNIRTLLAGSQNGGAKNRTWVEGCLATNRLLTKGAYQISYGEQSEGRRNLVLAMRRSVLFWVPGLIFFVCSWLPSYLYNPFFRLTQYAAFCFFRIFQWLLVGK